MTHRACPKSTRTTALTVKEISNDSASVAETLIDDFSAGGKGGEAIDRANDADTNRCWGQKYCVHRVVGMHQPRASAFCSRDGYPFLVTTVIVPRLQEQRYASSAQFRRPPLLVVHVVFIRTTCMQNSLDSCVREALIIR